MTFLLNISLRQIVVLNTASKHAMEWILVWCALTDFQWATDWFSSTAAPYKCKLDVIVWFDDRRGCRFHSELLQQSAARLKWKIAFVLLLSISIEICGISFRWSTRVAFSVITSLQYILIDLSAQMWQTEHRLW